MPYAGPYGSETTADREARAHQDEHDRRKAASDRAEARSVAG